MEETVFVVFLGGATSAAFAQLLRILSHWLSTPQRTVSQLTPEDERW